MSLLQQHAHANYDDLVLEQVWFNDLRFHYVNAGLQVVVPPVVTPDRSFSSGRSFSLSQDGADSQSTKSSYGQSARKKKLSNARSNYGSRIWSSGSDYNTTTGRGGDMDSS